MFRDEPISVLRQGAKNGVKDGDTPTGQAAGPHADLLALIHQRVRNLFVTRHMMCSEAVLAVLNQALGGGLPPEVALRLTSALPEGIGGSGCTCGALTGGSLALGLFLGRATTGLGNGRRAMGAARELHDGFKNRFGATCCRVLIRHLKPGSRAHFAHCAENSGAAAAMAARLILDRRPELAEGADLDYLKQRETTVGTRLTQLTNALIKPGR